MNLDRLAVLNLLDEELIADNLPPSYEALLGRPLRAHRHPLRALRHFLESGIGIAACCAFVSVAVLVAIIMAGRNSPSVPPVGTNPPTEEATNPPVTEEESNPPIEEESNPSTEKKTDPIPPDETNPRAVADEALQNAYPFLREIGLNSFNVSISEGGVNNPHDVWVDYTYWLGGLHTSEYYSLQLTLQDGVYSVTNIRASRPQTYTLFHNLCTEERIAAALAELGAISGEELTMGLGVFWGLEDDGRRLVLVTEQIVSITTPGSLLGEQGCGIDHEHKFYEVDVCTLD